MPAVETDSVEVLPSLQYIGGQQVVSDSDPVPWQTFVDMLPAVKAGGASSSSSSGQKAASASQEDLLVKYPWLARHLSSKEGDLGASSSSQSQQAPEAEAHEQVDMDDAALEEMFAELHQRRQLWEVDNRTALRDFQVTLSGSAWVQRNRGIPYDSFLGSAKGSDAKAWCRRYSLPLTNRFDVELYGEADANVLATTWCKTMQYYYDLYVESNMEVYVYTDTVFQGRPQPQDFAALVSQASGRKLQRAEGLRQLRPTNP
jgi:hypothetical protein